MRFVIGQKYEENQIFIYYSVLSVQYQIDDKTKFNESSFPIKYELREKKQDLLYFSRVEERAICEKERIVKRNNR